jgi:MFS family permease
MGEDEAGVPLYRQKRFALLMSGRVVSSLGNAVAPIAIAFAILQLDHSVGDLGLVVGGRSTALAVCILFGGVVADRLPRRVVMIGGAVVSGMSEAATALLLLTHTADIAELAALQIVNGISSAFVFPASQGILPQVVAAPSLHQANVALRMGTNAASILGAAVGGVVIAVVGSGWCVAFDAGTFFFAAAMFAMLRAGDARRNTAPAAKPLKSLMGNLAEGWSEFRSRTWLWTIVVQFAFVNAANGGVLDVLGPLTAQQRLGGAHSWGLLMGAYSGGALLGGFIVTALRDARRPLLLGNFGILLTIPFFALLAPPAPLAVLAVAALASGVGSQVFGVKWDVTMQRQIPEHMLSRVSAYDMLGSIVCMPLGQVAVGPLQSAIGRSSAIWVCALVATVATLAVFGVRDVRTMSGDGPVAGEQQPVEA